MPSAADDNFLEDEHMCGKTLLRIVSRGQAIIAQLQDLATQIPPIFLPENEKSHSYGPLLADFTTYLNDERQRDAFEDKINSSEALLELDEEFKESYLGTLQRFFRLFEAIRKYISDFNHVLTEIEDGVFIQQTFENIMMNIHGKQLMSEALYLYGVMLLLLDLKIDGLVRERMLIAYMRCSGSAGESENFDEVCKICQRTKFANKLVPRPGQEKKKKGDTIEYHLPFPEGYPEKYFQRIPIRSDVIAMIIGRLRSDDIYQMAYSYPAPEHRSAALANQAAMLYVIMFFQPDTLQNKTAIMREIVDKHFPDNWVINWYMGYTVDLSDKWVKYPAAKAALANVLTTPNINELVKSHQAKCKKLSPEIRDLLREGILTEGYVLDNIYKTLLPTVRDANVTLRWFVLHRDTTITSFKATIQQSLPQDELLNLLLRTAQLEFALKEMFNVLIAEKKKKWRAARETAVTKINAISDFFAGEGVLTSETKEEQLQNYFANTAANIEELDYHDSSSAGRKITTLIKALEDVEQYQQVYDSLQVRQFLKDTTTLLQKMLRYVNIKQEVAITIATVGDISYAWELINGFVDDIQQKIKKRPQLITQLRSTFLKLATMLEQPLTRIAQEGSPHLKSVGRFYSESLVAFVRRVLEIIPKSMFECLIKIITLQKTKLQELPTTIARKELSAFAQLDVRRDLASLTYEVSKFTEGILAMEKTLMGIIQIDPHKMLEEGVRKELVSHICQILHRNLIFTPPSMDKKDKSKDKKPVAPRNTFTEAMEILGRELNGMRNAFEYIQDYVGVFGLKIWQEEFFRIISYNVEQECNRFLKKKVLDFDSAYQSNIIPILKFTPVDKNNTFMGRLVTKLQEETDSRFTIYIDQLAGWYTQDNTGVEVVGLRTFSHIRQSMGTFGLTGIDRLLCFLTVTELQQVVKYIQKKMSEGLRKELDQIGAQLNPPDSKPRLRVTGLPFIQKMQPLFEHLLTYTMNVGRNQILRRHIASELKFSAKLDSTSLFNGLETFNIALLADTRTHYLNPAEAPFPARQNPLLSELNFYLENTGLTHPYSKVYITAESLPDVPLVLFLHTVTHLPLFTYEVIIDSLTCRSTAKGPLMSLDGVPFVVGVLTILKQFHSEHKDCYIAYLAQHARMLMDDYANDTLLRQQKAKKALPWEALPKELQNLLHLLNLICKLAPLPRHSIEDLLPPGLFSEYHFQPQEVKK